MLDLARRFNTAPAPGQNYTLGTNAIHGTINREDLVDRADAENIVSSPYAYRYAAVGLHPARSQNRRTVIAVARHAYR